MSKNVENAANVRVGNFSREVYFPFETVEGVTGLQAFQLDCFYGEIFAQL